MLFLGCDVGLRVQSHKQSCSLFENIVTSRDKNIFRVVGPMYLILPGKDTFSFETFIICFFYFGRAIKQGQGAKKGKLAGFALML